MNDKGQYLTDKGEVAKDKGLAAEIIELFTGNNSRQALEFGKDKVSPKSEAAINGKACVPVNPASVDCEIQESSLRGSVEFNVREKFQYVTIQYVAVEGGTASSASETVKENETAKDSTAVPNPGYYFVAWQNKAGEQVGNKAVFVPDKVEGKNVAATYTAIFGTKAQVNIEGNSADVFYNGNE